MSNPTSPALRSLDKTPVIRDLVQFVYNWIPLEADIWAQIPLVLKQFPFEQAQAILALKPSSGGSQFPTTLRGYVV